MLTCTAISAASNVILNLIWIPTYGAEAAAVNTLVSYVIFLASLAVAGWYSTELGRARTQTVGAGRTVINGMQE